MYREWGLIMSNGEKLTKGFAFNDWKLNWLVVGEHGGIHVHCCSNDFSSGGIEIHSNVPRHDGQSPSECNCWLTGAPCFHDGSSLQWSEYWSRMARMYLFEDRGNWRCPQIEWWDLLASEYASRFDTPAFVDAEESPKRWDAVQAERVRAAAASLSVCVGSGV